MAEDHDARAARRDRLGELRGRHDCLDAVREMVGIHRRLAADAPEDSDNPDDDAGQLAAALLLLALRQAEAGQHDKALAAAEEAAAIFRELANRQPDVVRLQDLAVGLTKLAFCASARERHDAAAEAATECVAVYRRLTGMTPGGFRADLMLALGTQCFIALDLGDEDGAFAAINEALTLACTLRDEEFRALAARILQIAQNYGCLCHHLGHDLQDDNRYAAVLAELWAIGAYDPYASDTTFAGADGNGNEDGRTR